MLALLIHCYAKRHFLVAAHRACDLPRYRGALRGRQLASRPRHGGDLPPHQQGRHRGGVPASPAAGAQRPGLLQLGTVSIDGTKVDANASKIRSVRYDRARALRDKLARDIADLMAQAEAADAEAHDPQELPEELARREVLKAKLDAACARMEADARAEAEAARPAYEAKRAAYDAKTGRRGRPPKPPDDEPPPERQSNLTDPDSALMRRSDAHEYRQAYNAQAVVCADGSQLVVATKLVATTADAPSFAAIILGMQDHGRVADHGVGRHRFMPAGPLSRRWRNNGIEPLVAIGRTQPHRPYDFRPPPKPKTPRRITEPWRVAMKAKLESDDGKSRYKMRKQTVEPVFGIIKSALGFNRFRLRGLSNAATEWSLVTLAYNCKRIARMQKWHNQA